MALKPLRSSNIGSIGEDIAAQYLERKGFRIVERNYRRKWGEIDLIAVYKNVVRFVEVKAISREIGKGFSHENNDYRPEEQIHPYKLKKIVRTAELYMAERNDLREFQIDAVGVFIDFVRRRARCRLWEQIM